MVCEMAQNATEKKYPKTVQTQEGQGPEISPQGSRKMTGSATQSKVPEKKKIRKKMQKGINMPAVPGYRFEKGILYDVCDSYKSLKGAEYAGHEIIGHLILYCFLDGGHPYKFSEPALRMYGKVRESASGAEVLSGT